MNVREATNPLPSVTSLADQAISVGEVAPPLVWLEPGLPASEARERLEQAGFAVAPVSIEGGGFVLTAELPKSGTVGERAQPIGESDRIDAALGLGPAIEELATGAHRFVFRDGEAVGMWSRADLQAPQVSLLTFAFGLAAEAGLSRMIEVEFGERWVEEVSDAVHEKIERVWEDKKRDGLQLTKLECAYLSDRLNLCAKSESIWRRLGSESRSDFDEWASDFIRLRNELAHGGNILRFEANPVAAVATFARLRDFAERAWA
jgi:hypothetical protein